VSVTIVAPVQIAAAIAQRQRWRSGARLRASAALAPAALITPSTVAWPSVDAGRPTAIGTPPTSRGAQWIQSIPIAWSSAYAHASVIAKSATSRVRRASAPSRVPSRAPR
jgi:hypothetical protein